MKIVAMVGSLHGVKGSTTKFVRIVLEGAEREETTTGTIYLPGCIYSASIGVNP